MQFGVGCPGFHLRFVVKASQTMITSKESEILCGPPNGEGLAETPMSQLGVELLSSESQFT